MFRVYSVIIAARWKY